MTPVFWLYHSPKKTRHKNWLQRGACVIQTLDELVFLSNIEANSAAAEGFPENANEIRLLKPGCTTNEIVRIREELPGIPESYLSVAAQVALPNVSIGFLNLAPGWPQDGSLPDRLVDANNPRWPLWEFVDYHDLYHVAEYEGDMICVVRDNQSRAGEVIRMDLSCPPTPELSRVAWSFEQLLLGFGRLREQFLQERLGSEVINEVLASLSDDYHLDDEQLADWTWFAEVALGEDELDSNDDLSEPLSGNQGVSDDLLGRMGLARPREATKSIVDADLVADVVSEYQRPVPKGFDAFAAIPTWPDWQIDNRVDRIDGSVFRSFRTRFDGHVYLIAQFPKPIRGNASPIPASVKPRIELHVVEGRPKPSNRDWSLRKLASFPIIGIEPTVEAVAELAAYRRRLPELLAELPARKKK
jgi:hypothetical protein